MVRLKSRYLLVQIHYPNLYSPDAHAPETFSKPGKSSLTITTNTTITKPNTSTNSPHPTIAFNASTPDSVTPQALLHLLRQKITQHYGDLGAGLVAGPSALAVKYFSAATSCFVLRCPRRWVRIVWGALSWVTHVRVWPGEKGSRAGHGTGSASAGERECVMRVLRVSGSIRKCEEALVKRARELCGRVKGEEVIAVAVRGGKGGIAGGAERVGLGDGMLSDDSEGGESGGEDKGGGGLDEFSDDDDGESFDRR